MRFLMLLIIIMLTQVSKAQSYDDVLKNEQQSFLRAINNLEYYNFENIRLCIPESELENKGFCLELLYTEEVRLALNHKLDSLIESNSLVSSDILYLCSHSCDSLLAAKGRRVLRQASSDEEKVSMLCFLTRMHEPRSIKQFLRGRKPLNVKSNVLAISEIRKYYYCEEGVKMISKYIRTNKFAVNYIVSDLLGIKDTMPVYDEDVIDHLMTDGYGEDFSTPSPFKPVRHYFRVEAFYELFCITNPDYWIFIGFPNPNLSKDWEMYNVETFLTKSKRHLICKWIRKNYGNYQLSKYMWR